MAWIEPVTTALAAAELANELAKSSVIVKRHAKRLAYRIKHGKAVIPLFGAGGVGKSTVGKLLLGANPLDLATPYAESWITEDLKLTGDVPGQLLIAPGQEARVDNSWPALLASVVEGTSFGIINVVSYGFHSFGLQSFKEHDLFAPGMSPTDFMLVYTAHRREVELRMLDRLLLGLSAATKPMWILTLVNKQDLWWSHRVDVRAHYEGAYAARIGDFATAMGSRHFQHEFLPVSLVLGNMTTAANEVLAETTGGYDFVRHTQYLNSMFTKVGELVAVGRKR